MRRVKSNYDRNGNLVYTSSPYAPVDMSDGDDDDLCVWDYLYDSDDEIFTNSRVNNKPTFEVNKTLLSDTPKEVLSSKQQDLPGKQEGNNSGVAGSIRRTEVITQPSSRSLEDPQGDIALVSAIQNLTMLSQYMLKLEARVGKTTHEAIRQTLDDTAEQAAIDFPGHDLSQRDLLQRIVRISEQTSRRMYLVDRYWRRQSSRKQGAQESQPLPLLDEASVKSWISIEAKDNHIMLQSPRFFTVKDLEAGRKVRDWLTYLSELCGFKDSIEDNRKLLNLAWRFLDRDLRGEIPSPSTNVDAFVSELEHKFDTGQFEIALADPENQERTDKDMWQRIRRLWSARTRPQ